MNKFKKTALVSACVATIGCISVPAFAANWLMLQGTEPADSGPRAKVWGFLQPTYYSTDGTKLPAGPFSGQDTQFNVHQPDLASSKTFQLTRARLGVRGTALPLDSKVNYFLLIEAGNNGITQPGGGSGSAKLTDATVTLNHIKGMRIRVGQMKVPMSEEVYQGIMTWNYINMTNMANQQLVERPFWTDGNTQCDPTGSSSQYLNFCNGDAQTQFRSSAAAVRDNGIQLFDTFYAGDGWEHSYAILLGNGGVNKDNRNSDFDTSLYWSSEKVFSGKGPWRDNMKFIAWQTEGKRTIYDSATLNAGGSYEAAKKEYDRKISGVGFMYQKDKIRFWTEYMKADGGIFNGSTGGAVPGAINTAGNNVSQFLMATDGEGDGGYVDFGYKVTRNLELDLRYDWYNRYTNSVTGERDYKTTTVGMQYWFNRKSKFLLNYEFREFDAPGYPSAAPPNQIADAIDDRVSAQVFLLF